MAEQEQNPYDPLQSQKKITEAYTGPKKMKEAKNLLDGVEDLVAKENLADNYRQSSAQ